MDNVRADIRRIRAYAAHIRAYISTAYGYAYGVAAFSEISNRNIYLNFAEMSDKRIIPRKDADFNTMQKRLFAKAMENITAWGLDPDWMRGPYEVSANNWNGKYAAYLDPLTRTPLIIAEKRAARKAYEPYVSLLVKGLRVNTRLTEDQRLELGLEDYDTTPTPASVPKSWPVAVITPVGPGLLRVAYYDSETGKKAKRKDIHGCEIRTGILPAPPQSAEEIQHSEFSARTPYTLGFDLSLRGKTVYVCLRWENTRVQKGPWSEIQSAVIP
jgi:hypothetical protein